MSTPGGTSAPSVLVVGSGWHFTSGISYYTCRLTNALAEIAPTRAVLMRRLIPKALYPGKDRVGTVVNDLQYADNVEVFDGVDWYWGKSMRQARAFLRASPPDVVILQWWTGAVLHSYLKLAKLAKEAGSQVIIEWHEVQDTGEARIPGVVKYVTKAMKAMLRRVDGHVVHSRYDLELLRRTYDLPDERVVLAAHGPYDHHGTPLAPELPAGPSAPTAPTVTNAEAALAAEVPSDEFTFLYFGIIRPYKGVEDLVAAFDLLPAVVRDSSRLVLVGETWENWTAPLDAVVASPNRDRITVVNRYVTDAEVSRYFADADAVVLPYRRSSSSGPLHIAMSAGLPVIVSEVGGLVEAAGEYAGTTFTPAADPAALATALQSVVAHKGERYTDPHSWDNTVAAYQRLFQAIGATSAPAAGLRSVA